MRVFTIVQFLRPPVVSCYYFLCMFEDIFYAISRNNYDSITISKYQITRIDSHTTTDNGRLRDDL